MKDKVRDFWQAAPCGLTYAAGDSLPAQLERHARERYTLEPFIPAFARFAEGVGRDVLEVGVGIGADHCEWAKARPRRLAGIDLTEAAIELTRARLAAAGLSSELQVADAEALPFPDESFDIIYSWGVLHHTPKTWRAVAEVRRVLRPGGVARIMLYHRASIVGALLWLRYGALARLSLREVYARHLESPGTQAFSIGEVRRMFAAFASVSVATQLSVGDLLEGAAGQRHQGGLLSLARAIWPRPLLRRMARGVGLFLLIEAAC